MTLTFDSVGAWNYLVTCLVEASDGIMKWFVGEVSGAGSGSGFHSILFAGSYPVNGTRWAHAGVVSLV